MSENADNQTPPTHSVPPGDAPRKKVKRKRRWVVRLLIALPVVLIALVLLTPTLLSLGFVLSMLAPTLRTSFTPNGRLEIGSWNFGWFSGQRLNGITLFDDGNAAVAHLNLKTDASIWSLIRGNYALGNTTIDGDFDARIDPETGRVNLLHIVGADSKPASKPEPTSPSAPKTGGTSPKPEKTSSPIDFAKVKGKVTVNLTGTVSASNGDSRAVPLTKVQTGNLVVDLNDIEHGIGIDGALKLSVDGKPATLSIKGSADAIQNNVLIDDPNLLAANLVATIEQLDLAVVKAALVARGMTDVDVSGLLKGRLVIDVKPGGAGSITSEDSLGVDQLAVSAPQLGGDTFVSKRVDFPINISRAAGSDEVKIEALGAKTDVATFSVTGSVSQKAIQNISASPMRAPGASSAVVVKADVPSFAALVAMLPRSTHLQQGVQVNGGGLSQTIGIDLTPDGIKANESLVINIDGVSNGRPIKLDKTTLDAKADLAIRDGQMLDKTALLAAVRSIGLNVAAPFATVNGSGVPDKMQLTGDVDLTKFFDDVSQFVDMSKLGYGKLDLKGKTTFNLATAGLPTGGGVFGATLGFKATGLVVTNDGEGLLNNENVNGDIDLLLKAKDDIQTVTFRKLNIGTDSGLIGVWTAGQNAWVSLQAGMPVAGDGEFHLRGKLERLAASFASAIEPSMQLKRGLLDSVIQFNFDPAKREYAVNSDVSLTKLDVGELLSNETFKFGAKTYIPEDRSTVKTWFEVASNFASVKGDADLLLVKSDKSKATPFEMARTVNFEGDVPSLPKLYALMGSLGGAATPPTPAGTAPLPPLRVDGGSVAFSGKLSRDDAKRVTSVALNIPGVRDLSLSRGAATFKQAEPITMSLLADITTDPTKPTLTQQLQQIMISKLAVDVPGIVKVSMPQAVEFTHLDQPTPSAAGTVQADGALQPLGEFLAVIKGSNPLPVSGTFSTQQKIATQANSIFLSGTGKLDAVQPVGKDAKPLPENLRTVELANDLSMDTKAKSINLKNFSLTAPRAPDVLALSANGTLRELGTNNVFDGFVAKLAYDLPQLWPLAQPFVDPKGESIGRVENLAGKYEKTFKISGSYPTIDERGRPLAFADSIRTLEVSGDVQLDSASLVDKGVDLAHVSIPVLVMGGVARIANADGSAPADFDINSGKGRVAGVAVDLTAGEPLISKLDKLPLVTNATLNPVMSNVLGKYFNPVFPNATKARALVTLLVSADHLKLGKSLSTEGSGEATLILSLTDMEISNPLGEQLLGGLINKASGALNLGGSLRTSDFENFRGELKNATYTLDRGVVTQKATFMLGNVQDTSDPKAKPNELYPFTFGGTVKLSNLVMDLDAGLPTQLLRQKINGGSDIKKVLDFLPDELRIGFTGPTTKPKIDFKDASKAFSEAFLQFGASRLAGDKGSGKNGDKVGDLIGGLLGGKEKSKPDDKKPDEPKADDSKKKKKKAA